MAKTLSAKDFLLTNGASLSDGSADPSAGAGVSAAVGSIYLRTNGSTYIKTGAGDTAWAAVPASSGLGYNVVDYGATGDGVTDDTAAIQSAITAAINAGGGRIYFPAGTYLVDRDAAPGSFDINARSNLLFEGQGDASVIKATGQNYTNAFYLFYIRGASSNIWFQRLKFDGNRANIASADTSTHLVSVQGATDVRFDQCTFASAESDGLEIQSNTNTRITVTDCRFTDNGRYGLSIGSGTSQVIVQGCHFDDNVDEAFFFIASGSASYITFAANQIEHPTPGTVACSIQDADHISMTANRIIDGTLTVQDTTSFAFSGGNQIVGADPSPSGALDGLVISGSCADCVISGNTIRPEMGATAIKLERAGGVSPARITISGNSIVAWDSHGIEAEDTGDLAIIGNSISDRDGDQLGNGIYISSPNAAVDAVLIAGNTISGHDNGIEINPASAITKLTISHNTADGYATAGYNFTAGASTCTAPIWIGNQGSLAGTDFDHLVTGGNADSLVEVQASGTPESAIAAPVGSLCHRTDGGAGTSLYVKESGTGNTGWVGK